MSNTNLKKIIKEVFLEVVKELKIDKVPEGRTSAMSMDQATEIALEAFRVGYSVWREPENLGEDALEIDIDPGEWLEGDYDYEDHAKIVKAIAKIRAYTKSHGTLSGFEYRMPSGRMTTWS